MGHPTSDARAAPGFLHQRFNGVPEQIYGLPRYTDGSSLDLPRSTYLAPAGGRWRHDSTQAFANAEYRLPGEWKLKVNAENICSPSVN